MEHVDKCQKCGKEYIADANDTENALPTCGTCGAEIYRRGANSEFSVTGDNDDEHPIERGLRKVTDELTGDKKKV
ncbi:hypothetical protein [Halomonas citrativorans]|uniref:Uncharacterized protein n=1 Tax=Halomonas citrativorans TaxID=2742612 RepID=A0ABR9F977_9GAMM|nr:hypothetical protein [Halomonas citrativorans]MBE0403038.1 hypothetical protein [Halomonas citrativorans]